VRRLAFESDGQVAEAGRLAVEVVARGGVVLLPTETFYGLGVDPRRPDAVARVLAMKGRPDSLALPVLCADWAQLEELAEVPLEHRVRLGRIWPGPLTAVLRARREVPSGRQGTLAVRIPGHAMLRALLYLTGPLTGTSANRHGAPPPVTVEQALESLLAPPELVLDGGATGGGAPSTVVDLTGQSPVLLRSGAYLWEEPYPWPEWGLPPSSAE
jgi:L-threonylcarbamoyladenylate synthase